MPSIMLDLKTLSVDSNAHILSIGACTVEDKPRTFHEFLGKSQFGSHIDADTVLWWMKQRQKARERIYSGVEKARAPAAVLGGLFPVVRRLS